MRISACAPQSGPPGAASRSTRRGSAARCRAPSRGPTRRSATSRPSVAARNRNPTPIAELEASPMTDLRSSGSSRLASVNSQMCAIRTIPYADAKTTASSPNASGRLSDATRKAAIAAKMPMRTAPSSGSITLVSHAYPPHDHQSIESASRPGRDPPRSEFDAISAVHCVSARTKTRSKNSSSGVTRSSSRREQRSSAACGTILHGWDPRSAPDVRPTRSSRART